MSRFVVVIHACSARLRRHRLCWQVATALLLALSSLEAGELPQRPNIVVILADDLGWSDLGCYGGEIATPRLDAMARDGLRFTQFYNCGRCCPTRAALMTGLYPHQAGVGAMTFDMGKPGYRGRLTPNTVTIAELLSAAGYRTLMAGKWHLSLTADSPENARWVSHRLDRGPFSDVATYPVGRGFDEHYGTIWGVVNYFDPFSLVRNTTPIAEVPDDFYYTDALSDEAVRMIGEAGAKAKTGEQPFFLYLAYTAPHWPLHALDDDVKRYADAYKDGWNAVRQRRYESLMKLGLLSSKTAMLSEPASGRPWSEEPHREWESRAMAVHAAMITRMDAGIGRVLDSLQAAGLSENTVVLFLSDNGASPERIGRAGFDRPSHTRDGREVGYPQPDDPGPPPGSETTFAGIGRRWANVANTPFRKWKATTYEGGICTPAIACWPATIGPGVSHDVCHVIDVMATCCDLGEAPYPATRNGVAVSPLAGRSLRPTFEPSEDSNPADEKVPRTLFWEHEDHRAAREGRWKFVGPAGGAWELYDLESDRTETHDVAAKHADLVAKLSQAYDDWAENVGVVPRNELHEP